MTADSPPRDTRSLFYVLSPDAGIARALHEQAFRRAPKGARVMEADSLHLTLAFIGNVDAAQLPVIEAVGDAVQWPRLELTLDDIGVWPHNKKLYAAPTRPPAALATLATALTEGLRAAGVTLQRPGFNPHLTLVRECSSSRTSEAAPPLAWSVTGGHLIETNHSGVGPQFNVLRHWTAT